MSQLFIERMKRNDPSQNVPADVLVDTNVIVEFDTQADLLRLADELGPEGCLRSSKFRYRQLRARHSIVLAWWFAKNKINAAVLGNEAIDVVTTQVATPRDPPSYAVGKAIYHIVRPFVWRGWHIAALVDVDHTLTGEDADDELLRVAFEEKLPLITWEGFTEKGFVSNAKKLRAKCLARGVSVHTPKEYLQQMNVNVLDESTRLLFACKKALREARAKRILEGKNVLDFLIPMYRLILLDEVDPRHGVTFPPAGT